MTTTKRLVRVNLTDVKIVETILDCSLETGTTWDLAAGCAEAKDILPKLRAEIVALRQELKSLQRQATSQDDRGLRGPMTPYGRCLLRL